MFTEAEKLGSQDTTKRKTADSPQVTTPTAPNIPEEEWVVKEKIHKNQVNAFKRITLLVQSYHT